MLICLLKSSANSGYVLYVQGENGVLCKLVCKLILYFFMVAKQDQHTGFKVQTKLQKHSKTREF